jgi:peptidoglycan/xylan/chitin deacetylase (PgdA/CDA1 family)
MRDRITIKRHIGQLYALLKKRDAQRKLIFLYHSVGDTAEATAKQVFRDHIADIVAMGRLLPLRDILGSTPDRAIAVAITFDDGYATLKDHAAVILADFGCSATVFLNVGEIGDRERRASRAEDGYYSGEEFLTWRDVDSLVAAGWSVGSHGVHHVDLVTASNVAVKNELSISKSMIEKRLGKICDMFAYPWGRKNRRLLGEVRSAGYRYGFSGDHSRLTSRSDPLALPRINVAKEYLRDDVAAILRGDWDYLYWVSGAKAAFNSWYGPAQPYEAFKKKMGGIEVT